MSATARELARAVAESVTDPELPMITLHDLGMLRRVRLEGDRVVVELTPTYTGCPAIPEMRADLAGRLRDAGFADVEVRLTLDPPWSSDHITPRGREVLAQHGIAPPDAAPWPSIGPVPLVLGAAPPRPVCPRCGSTDTERLAQFSATACKSLHRCRGCTEPFEHIKAI